MNTESDKKIKDLIGSLQKELVDHLPAITHSTRSRLLRIYDVWRQVNLRRTIDLSEGAADFFEKGRIVPGCTLTRSVFETVGIQYYVQKKLVSLSDKSDPESIHKLLLFSGLWEKR